jgi:hypothetical protein
MIDETDLESEEIDRDKRAQDEQKPLTVEDEFKFRFNRVLEKRLEKRLKKKL